MKWEIFSILAKVSVYPCFRTSLSHNGCKGIPPQNTIHIVIHTWGILL